MTAHEDVGLFIELDMSKGFGEVVADVVIGPDSGHFYMVVLYPVLENKDFGIHVTSTFGRPFGVGHKKSTSVVFIQRSQ